MISIVIGAGIVGLHVARVLRERGHDVYVLEREPYLAEHTSGRNSGVIHSGVFYQPDSFKEKICIEGNLLTYEWLKKLNVPHAPCGKWIVPEEGQENEMEAFYQRIKKLPIPFPERVSARQLQEKEPALRPSEAIFIPSTGILDAAAYVKALANHMTRLGVEIVMNCLVMGLKNNVLETSKGDIPFDLVINAAGLDADKLAVMSGMVEYSIRPCRGDYFVLNKQPVMRPVYHLPYRGAHGLGVHLTPTLDGQTLLGPNAFFIDEKADYQHRSSPEAFEKAVRFYLPHLKKFHICASYSGNRPKLYKHGEPTSEFVIEMRQNWIHLLGIESPGLTAAPALAHHISSLV